MFAKDAVRTLPITQCIETKNKKKKKTNLTNKMTKSLLFENNSLFHGNKYNYNEKLNNKVLNQNTQMWKYSEQLSHTGSCSSSPLSQLGLWSIRMVAIFLS